MKHNAPLITAPRTTSSATLASRAFRSCILVGLSVLLLTGCEGKQTGDLAAYVQEVKNRQKSNIPPLPEPQEYEQFIYDESSLRDPFEIPQNTRAKLRLPNSGLQPDLKRSRDVLEQYNLGSLRMVGSIEKNNRRWALIIAPDGSLHRTTTGQHMGQDNGEITKITESQIELKEIVPDGLGGWIERRSTLSVSE